MGSTCASHCQNGQNITKTQIKHTTVQDLNKEENHVRFDENVATSNTMRTERRLKSNISLRSMKNSKISRQLLEQDTLKEDSCVQKEETENIVHKQLQVVNGNQTDRLIILEGFQDASKTSQSQRASVNEKVKISVDWGSFIKLKKKDFTEEYRTVAQLGRGGFGLVYKVQLRGSNIQRAVKSIRKNSLIEEDQKKVFMQMSILKELDHPNIVKLHEIYDWKNCYYLVTELCEGGDLFDYIQKHGRFSEKTVAEIMKQMLSPIVYMHKKGIIHRDIKPENIMFSKKDPGSALKIIDFGTSNKIRPGQFLRKQIGSPFYVAPEVLNRKYNQKCDIWACGVIMFIMLCGSPPFTGSQQKQILLNIKHQPLKFEKSSWKFVSPQAVNLIKRMLERNIEKRISAVDALNSPWINGTCSEIPLRFDILHKIKDFHFKNKFKAVVLTYIASQLTSNQNKRQLQKIFKDIDLDNDGVIEKGELLNAFQNHCSGEYLTIDVGNILRIVDINNSGKIDYTQFLLAASTEEEILNGARLDDAFEFFDADHSGYINVEELRHFLTGESEASIIQFFNDFDKNGDGRISKHEFKKLLKQKAQIMESKE